MRCDECKWSSFHPSETTVHPERTEVKRRWLFWHKHVVTPAWSYTTNAVWECHRYFPESRGGWIGELQVEPEFFCYNHEERS